MLVIINETNEIIFRGDVNTAKQIFGNGKYEMVVRDQDTGALLQKDNYTLSLKYEDTPHDNLQYLLDTDWYLIREMDTGKSVPADIKQKRLAIRGFL